MIFFILAFKNIFRQPFKAILMITSICVVLGISLIIKSYQNGTEKIFLQDLVFSEIGTSVITAKNKNDFFESSKLGNLQGIARLENVILGKKKPKKNENNIEHFTPFLLRGQNIFQNKIVLKKNEIAIGKSLASIKKWNLNDTIILNFNEEEQYFIIKTIFEHKNISLYQNLILINLTTFQSFLQCKNCLSSFHFQNSFPYLSQKKQLDTSLQHQNWYEIMPEIKQMLEADKWVWEIFLMILSVLLFLSFLGMNLLQIQQRKQEIQIFYFLGISKIKIFWLFCIEIFFYCILALLFTFMLVMPLLWYWQNNPIILTGIVAKSLIEIGLTPTLILQLNIENLILPLKICFILILLQIPFIYFYLKKQL